MFDYLASPYTHPDAYVRRERYHAASRALRLLLLAHYPAYSPIVHCHHLSEDYGLPHDAKFWQWYDENMLDASRSLIVLKLSGWEQSKGVAAEMLYARNTNLPLRTLEIARGDRLVFEEVT